MTSSLISIMAAEKLTGENYTTWKNNINTILVVDDMKFVLIEKPVANAAQNVHDSYDCWIRINEKVRVYILTSITDVLAKKLEGMTTSYEMMESLHITFAQPSDQIKHGALKHIYNARMKEGTSMREHVLQMMVHFNVAEMKTNPVRLVLFWKLSPKFSFISKVMLL